MEAAFTKIYEEKTWIDPKIVDCPLSGPGSTSAAMAPFRTWLTQHMAKCGYISILDLGCGDHVGMAAFPLPDSWTYTGLDVVKAVVEDNTAKYGSANRKFFVQDYTDPAWVVPAVEVVLIKDSLQHIPNMAVLHVLWQLHEALDSGRVKEVLIMNDDAQTHDWQNIEAGDYRPLSPSRKPMSLFFTQVLQSFGPKKLCRLLTRDPVVYDVVDSPEPMVTYPMVCIAILAKDKEGVLPTFLNNIKELDYPKSRIMLYIRTNNNTDRTPELLDEFMEWAVGHGYARGYCDSADVEEQVQRFGDHEWNTERFKVLGKIRQDSMQWAVDNGADYYYVQDVDNFVQPATLKELVALQLPIVAPLLRKIEEPDHGYSNFHTAIDVNGYYADSPIYFHFLLRRIRGVVEQPVVHCTYLVRADTIPKLTYLDDTGRYEYVIFSHSARKAGVPQYLDTRRQWGWLTMYNRDFKPGALHALLATHGLAVGEEDKLV